MRPIDADELLDEICREQCERKFTDCDGMCEMAAVVVNAPTIGGWISVRDRLPDTYKRVITYDKYSGVKENWLLKEKPCVDWSQGFHVTHWMPLPEPPKEETKADQKR